MKIVENKDLTKFNTFGVKAKAKFFVEISAEDEIKELFSNPVFQNNEKLFLGGGSNILFTKDFNGIVILNKLLGIEKIKEDEDNVWIKAFGGEVWHDLVEFAVENNYWGIENLSLIPGSVGAAPMQNIGAYGVEIKDTLETVEVYDVESIQKKIFKNEECDFGYRESIFKNTAKGKYFILAIVLKLSKKENKKTDYKVLKNYLEENKIEVKSARDVSQAVSEIRKSKLPDPKILGNSGSFFKNVFVSKDILDKLLLDYPNMPYFIEGEEIKIPTGWLIESAGFKGERFGNVGMHIKQALVLVNYGGASGEEIYNFAEKVIDIVYEKFGLKIIPEVNIYK